MSVIRFLSARHATLLVVAVAAFAAYLVEPVGRVAPTALDRYVHDADSTYACDLVSEVNADGVTRIIVHMKSQTWRTDREVDRPMWRHRIEIVKPNDARLKTALLYIAEEANARYMVEETNARASPTPVDNRALAVARATSSVVALLWMVPNEPLVFHSDDGVRRYDDLVAYSWAQYLKTGDETWPIQLPMVKSAIRAMNCVQHVLASDQGGNFTIADFVVAGDSKRGAAALLTAAVDQRVAAVIPTLMDALNLPASNRHHVAVYGFYSAAVGDYFKNGITRRMNDPSFKKLDAIVDPYSYRDRLTMPKFIVNAAGDEFYPPDSSQFYYDDLKGETYLRYVPNAKHSLDGNDLLDSVVAFYQTVLSGTARPKYSWTFEPDGAIRVSANAMPREVKLWQATNPSARDFRLDVIGKAYTSTAVEEEQPGVYVGRITPPQRGWTAFFVELTFDVGAAFPLKVTTAVRVLPEELPHRDIDPATAPLEQPVPSKATNPATVP